MCTESDNVVLAFSNLCLNILFSNAVQDFHNKYDISLHEKAYKNCNLIITQPLAPYPKITRRIKAESVREESSEEDVLTKETVSNSSFNKTA